MNVSKLRRDGEVAVVYNSYYGSGWYTHHNNLDLLFDASVAQWVIEQEYGKLTTYLSLRYPEVMWPGRDFRHLAVRWIPEGQEFYVTEYDGRESVVMKHEFQWIQA